MPTFRQDAETSLAEFKAALSALLDECDAADLRAQDVARQLGIDKSLAWKTTRLVATATPLDAMNHLFGSQAFDILLDAASRKGASATVLDRCRVANDAVNEVIKRHAGDRATLTALASGYSRDVMVRSVDKHLRDMYRAASFVWGLQSRVRLRGRVSAPSETPGTVDVVSFGGLADFRRLREGATASLGFWECQGRNDDEGPFARRLLPTATPIDTRIDPNGVPFMLDYCSSPVPNAEVVEHPNDLIEYRLRADDVGADSLSTVMTASIVRGSFPRHARVAGGSMAWFTSMEVPSEIFYFDLLVHESLYPWFRPSPRLQSQAGLHDFQPGQMPSGERLPIPLAVEDMGLGVRSGRNAELPDYESMLTEILEAVGWDPREFRLYRLAFPHPPIGTLLRLDMPLEPPVD